MTTATTTANRAHERADRADRTMLIAVAVIGLTITLGLSAAAWMAHDNNEKRLLDQRTREAAAVLTAALPSIQTPLASASELAEATDGTDSVAFQNLMQPFVQSGRPYVSASIWRLDTRDLQPVMVVGDAPKLLSQPPEQIRQFLEHSASLSKLAVIGLMDGNDPKLGYSFTSSRTPPRFVAYAEAALPADRTAVVRSDNAFSGLANAVYLGTTEDPAQLLTASTSRLPLPDHRSTQTVQFGDSSLLLVMHPTSALGGKLMAALPWLVAIFGLLATAGATIVAHRLVRRRSYAESLARDNARLYAGERNVAKTLQHSLLPDQLPTVPGLEFAVRYESGEATMDVGGDWYDVMDLGEGRVLFVVGDVSGRGLKAASVMASLRYAIRAFATLGLSPAEILSKLAPLLNIDRDGCFATVICGVVDIQSGTFTIANAGHPEPIMVERGHARTVEAEVGLPIGVRSGSVYRSRTIEAVEGATLLLFTDGLFERRGETVDDGIERLRRTSAAASGSLEDVLGMILDQQRSEGAHDDTAVLGMRWLCNNLNTATQTSLATTSSLSN